jgi:hypothetical protein
VLAAGGDWMPAARFYSIALPFSAGYIAWSLFTRERFSRVRVMVALTAIFCLNQVAVAAVHYPYIAKLQQAEDRTLQRMVTDLNSVAGRDDTLALSDIGRASYGFVGKIFDWWGLASRIVISRNESLGRIKSQTIREADPEFLVVYSNSEESPSSAASLTGMAIASRAIVSDRGLMSRYCRLHAYYFWESRYHILLARRDVAERLGSLPVVPAAWSVHECKSIAVADS